VSVVLSQGVVEEANSSNEGEEEVVNDGEGVKEGWKGGS
jgi:hypothetical protein